MQRCLVLEPFTTYSSFAAGSDSFQKTTRYLYSPQILRLSLFSPQYGLAFPDHQIHAYKFSGRPGLRASSLRLLQQKRVQSEDGEYPL